MYSRPVSDQIKTRRPRDMSYMFGAHMSGNSIFFSGDGRVASVDATKIPYSCSSEIPMWLFCDWIFALKRGEPLTEYALLSLKSVPSELNWLL